MSALPSPNHTNTIVLYTYACVKFAIIHPFSTRRIRLRASWTSPDRRDFPRGRRVCRYAPASVRSDGRDPPPPPGARAPPPPPGRSISVTAEQSESDDPRQCVNEPELSARRCHALSGIAGDRLARLDTGQRSCPTVRHGQTALQVWGRSSGGGSN